MWEEKVKDKKTNFLVNSFLTKVTEKTFQKYMTKSQQKIQILK